MYKALIYNHDRLNKFAYLSRFYYRNFVSLYFCQCGEFDDRDKIYISLTIKSTNIEKLISGIRHF
jgi:hypothetical protein